MSAMHKTKKKRRKVASDKRHARKPQNWDKAISAAYIRLLGAGAPKVTQAFTANQVGVAERTIRNWEAAPWWPKAQAEAKDRWLKGGDASAMRGIHLAMNDPDDHARTARWWAERRMPGFEPPKVRSELSGPNGGPIPTNAAPDLSGFTDDELRQLDDLFDKAERRKTLVEP